MPGRWITEELSRVFPFKTLPNCELYYYITYSAIALVFFLLFAFISKWYKLRRRDDIVPFHMLAEDYFEKNYIREHNFYQQYGYV